MSALCIECTHSSLRGVEPRTELFCQRHEWVVVSTDTCSEFESLSGNHRGLWAALEVFSKATSIKLTPAGEAFFDVKRSLDQGRA